MRNLISADVDRVLRKKSYWIALVIMCIYSVGHVILQKTEIWTGFAFMGRLLDRLPILTSLVLGMILFLGIYGDEMTSMTVITVIGRGLPRWKVIAAKYIDAAILSAIFMALFSVCIAVISLVSGAHMSAYQTVALYLGMAKIWFTVVMQLSIACMVVYITSNTALGVFALLLVNMILPIVVIMIKMIPVIRDSYFPERYLCGGFAARVYTNLMLGFPMSALLSFLAGTAIYILLPLVITAKVYEKKEMDF